jgi:hypothetical protein
MLPKSSKEFFGHSPSFMSVLEGLAPENRFVGLDFILDPPSKKQARVDAVVSFFDRAAGTTPAKTLQFHSDSNGPAFRLFRTPVQTYSRAKAIVTSPSISDAAQVLLVWSFGTPAFYNRVHGLQATLFVLMLPPCHAIARQFFTQRKLTVQEQLFLLLYAGTILYLTPFLNSAFFKKVFPMLMSAYAITNLTQFMADQQKWLIFPSVMAVLAVLFVLFCSLESVDGFAVQRPDNTWPSLVFPIVVTSGFLTYALLARSHVTEAYAYRFRYFSTISALYIIFSFVYDVLSVMSENWFESPVIFIARTVVMYLYTASLFHGYQETDDGGVFVGIKPPGTVHFPEDNPIGVDLAEPQGA